ncbi:MAG: response regulator [Gammaproteobacteria bacterium]|nr:response regulator [Gammaproteobacteria bacterium]
MSAHFIDSANERGNSAADQKLWRSHTTSFTWAGQELALRYTATSAYRKAFQTWVPTGVLLAALALTVLVAAMLHLLRGQTARITQEVADRTRELQEANRDLEDHINRRIRVEQRLKAYRQDLEREVADRTSELNATTTKLRTILDSEPECVKIVSSDGRLEDMNPAGLAMIEAESLDQVRGSNVYSLIAEEYRDAFIDLNEQVIAGKSCTLQFKLNGLRGGVRWVDTSAVPLVDPDGGPTRHLAITRDITARKSEEEERARMELQLRHTQKLESIGVMAGGIAHDFNNLLQIIIGHGEIALHDESIRGHTRELLETSQSAAIDAASLCDQMLTYAGKSQPEKQTVELRRLVESMGNLLEVTRSENTEFEVLCDEVDDKIDGDVAQLRQVVMNLITNAAESIGDQPGRIAVTIRMTEVTADIAVDNWVGAAPPTGQYVGFDVADSGCGLNEKTRERMFDPFFTTKFTGRGLGLASTLGIIKSHHGFIKVESRVGHGTCVTVLFPVSVKSEQKIAEPLHPPKPMSKTVLIVDDDEGVRRIGQMILERLGCRVESAADGENALRKLTNLKDSIDIVLLDVAMPGMNGNEVSARLRSIRPDIPIIFCSGYAADAVEPAPHSVGYTGFLRKPYRSDDLLEALRKAVRSQNPAKVAAVSAQ